ncbi:hypothetical protein [Lentilactobacillus hilgardii]|uniref:Uncharacterized protein n=1 Tax=Lentilactobacillus hilgardii (strain ATCC 8290 / DSM 20176 / CCUG 30140 / JCM 1155 / KCTC 3500 / NBRC 15886 / NCIMB 8040 / NRRL B-1843 / 9) TaxID=1423757 RepID=C0XGH5_LENH9|nr:hypothetical protein [Lentilactobacillus hilgardii]EEI19670.1 hypothetical protein HMPREF0497_1507 [Lentilactobacillus buchneri ATCC 11577]EEI25519.1 hypothetical protein HMPREF0519_0336 [Lentilactobacillus hilgardii DSM 20176 = ATCC 8290]KRK56628.1 hypothetical protein FD42_GL000316 [Lentilactobacillus hilgardii DSM 20176 = ATCC 8290]QIR10485.1 hypothetical protein G8J22_02493 [Lentilactobacillus hilgardii]TDG83778.1 hypothetical protein C5L34_000123 [Lentilactobacillus hilgardii]
MTKISKVLKLRALIEYFDDQGSLKTIASVNVQLTTLAIWDLPTTEFLENRFNKLG